MHAVIKQNITSINILETFQKGHVERQTTIHTLAPVANLMFPICLMWMFFVLFFLLWEEVVEKHQKLNTKKVLGIFCHLIKQDLERLDELGKARLLRVSYWCKLAKLASHKVFD